MQTSLCVVIGQTLQEGRRGRLRGEREDGSGPEGTDRGGGQRWSRGPFQVLAAQNQPGPGDREDARVGLEL